MQRPETVIFVTEILGYVVAAASALSSTLLVYIVYHHSPREMGAYKWYIAFNATSCGAFDVVYAAAHPEALFPAPIIVAGGILKDCVLPDFLIRLGVVVMLMPLGGLVGSVLAMVIFRFCQTAQGKVFFGLFNPQHFLLTCISLLVLVIIVFILSFNMFSETSRDAVLRGLVSNFPDVVPQLEHRTFLSLKSMNNGWTLFTGCFTAFFVVTFSVLIGYCVYGCYASLRQSIGHYSPKTLRLYRALVNSLVLDFIICIFVGVVPVTGIIASVFVHQSEWTSAAIEICMCVASFYPLASHAVWLTYITPYRIAVLRILRFRWLRRSKSNATLFLASPSETRA